MYALAPDDYEVSVGYGPKTTGGPGGSGAYRDAGVSLHYPLDLGPRPRGTVRANETTMITVELARALGVVSGAVALNNAPPGDGFFLCTYAGTGEVQRGTAELLWCTPLAADGVFRQLLPKGPGIARVCFADVVDPRLGCVERKTETGGGKRGGTTPTSIIATFNYDVLAGRTIDVTGKGKAP
jgi:hypothetical protein